MRTFSCFNNNDWSVNRIRAVTVVSSQSMPGYNSSAGVHFHLRFAEISCSVANNRILTASCRIESTLVHNPLFCSDFLSIQYHLYETYGQIITVPVELHTTAYLPCRCPICPESTVGVQWYRSSNSDAFIKDGQALAWWAGRNGSSQGFGIKEDFSMVIYNITVQHDLYRCIVIPVSGSAECTHDVKLGIYANPDYSPVIDFIRETDGFNVTCSVSYVFPMTFPILTSKDGKRTAYNNSDGTFNTAVTHLFPANEKDTTIECLYYNLNFKSIASLRIFGSDTIDQNTTDDTDNTDCRPRPSGLWMIWIILITEVIFLIIIVIAIKTGRVIFVPALHTTIKNSLDDMETGEHHGGNSEKEEPVKCKMILKCCSKLYFGVATLTIQIIVVILLVTYIPTVSC